MVRLASMANASLRASRSPTRALTLTNSWSVRARSSSATTASVSPALPSMTIGFIGCAAGLLLASFSLDYTGATRSLLLFGGFMLFNFMTNFGPNAQTYLLAGELFPTRIRGKGAGFAAAFAKMGAVLTAFLFPILLADIGTKALLFGLVAASLLGALVTYLFRIETTGLNLEKLEAGQQQAQPRSGDGQQPQQERAEGGQSKKTANKKSDRGGNGTGTDPTGNPPVPWYVEYLF